jgi:hypothetical protein
MTIIVYRDGTMAADTGIWTESVAAGHTHKIRRMDDGGLVGCSGAPGFCEWFCRWLTSHPSADPMLCAKADHPTINDQGFGAVWVKPDGAVWKFNMDLLPFEVIGPWVMTGGSAIDVATGALAAGATAEEAVRIAIRYSDGAAGDVQTEKLLPVPLPVPPFLRTKTATGDASWMNA